MLYITTGEIKEFSGYWNWKEIYSQVKSYEKSQRWKILKIEKDLKGLKNG